MGSLESEAISKIVESVNMAIPKAIEKASFDKTIVGEIVSIEANGIYGVDIRGKTYKIYSSTDMTFTLHERVWITIPCNNFNDKYISGRKRGV